MIQYKRIDVSEGIEITKSNESKECMLCHYWYFKHIGYEYEQYFVMDAIFINDGL